MIDFPVSKQSVPMPLWSVCPTAFHPALSSPNNASYPNPQAIRTTPMASSNIPT